MDEIEKWLQSKWRTSRKGAIWKNFGDFNISVMEDDRNDGQWKARIVDNGKGQAITYLNGFASEIEAKRAVLTEMVRIRDLEKR